MPASLLTPADPLLDQISLQDAAHLIQTALTPVFLLSGIGALLNVFAGRLARVADQADALTNLDGNETVASEKLLLLRRRALILDVAVVLATGGAAATCLSILALFLFALSNRAMRRRITFHLPRLWRHD